MTGETLRQGVQLMFYTRVHARHGGKLVSEWLLERARKNGYGGGSVFRAIAGFGRHAVLHEEQFFELADDLPVKVEFLLEEAQAEQLLGEVRDAGVDITYARMPVRYAVIGVAKDA